MLGALAEGPSSISGFLAGADCLATLAALRAMGVAIDQPAANEVRIQGVGLRGLQAPGQELDMGNSGTAMRLFMGLLAGQSFDSTLIGDASLTRRPMERVAKPLREMGAAVVTRDGCPPVQIRGGRPLSGIDYAMPVASAQVKSAILLAGLYAQGETAGSNRRSREITRSACCASLAYPCDVRARVSACDPAPCCAAVTCTFPAICLRPRFSCSRPAPCRAATSKLSNVGLNPDANWRVAHPQVDGCGYRGATADAERRR